MVKTKFFPSFASIYTGKGFDPGGGGVFLGSVLEARV